VMRYEMPVAMAWIPNLNNLPIYHKYNNMDMPHMWFVTSVPGYKCPLFQL